MTQGFSFVSKGAVRKSTSNFNGISHGVFYDTSLSKLSPIGSMHIPGMIFKEGSATSHLH
jgi:hypothetical protein